MGPEREEVAGVWRKLHDEQLSGVYSPNIFRVVQSRRMRCAEDVTRVRDRRSAYRVLVVRLEGKRPLGRPRCTWEDNIKLDFQDV